MEPEDIVAAWEANDNLELVDQLFGEDNAEIFFKGLPILKAIHLMVTILGLLPKDLLPRLSCWVETICVGAT